MSEAMQSKKGKTAAEERPWFAGGLGFECTGCGNCCTGGPGFIWISDIETQRLADHLRLAVPQVQQQYCRKLSGGVSLKEKARNASGEYDCIFLKTEEQAPAKDGGVAYRQRQCSIYQVRPLQCRTWPFWEGLLSSEDMWNEAAGRCPGINRGRRYSYDEIIALRDAKDWPGR